MSFRPHALVLLILSGVQFAGTLPASAQNPGTPPVTTNVVVDKVRRELMSQMLPVLGRFVPKRAGVVAARVAGPLQTFLVEVGDRVKAGDVIAELVTASFIAERDRYAADVATAKAKVESQRERVGLVEQELDRIKGLRKSPAFTPAKFEDKEREAATAESQLAEAHANLKSAEAALQLAEIQLKNGEILAPYGGIVTQRHTESGAYVRPGDPIVNMIDDENLEIEADIPVQLVSGLTPGRKLTATLDQMPGLAVTVRAVIPEENPRSRTRR
ncbi:MAG: efflux RND transporter periplasmic adaptor subunit, partial [Proteobacteria bacterium]|nr:efflux RND transporter periplasmic adaptor subunit [Pseudomonadota bacterium]